MNSFLLYLFLLTIPCLQSESALHSPSEEMIKEVEIQIEKRQSSTRTLTAQFTQSVLPRNHSKPILSQGKLQYQKPQTLRIDFTSPEGEGMILTPQESTTWKKGLLPKSFPHDPLKPSFRRIILDILEKHPADWNQEFKKTILPETDSLLIHLTPLIPSEQAPEQVSVRMRSQDLQITALTVTMKEVQWGVQFHSIRVNPPLKIKLHR